MKKALVLSLVLLIGVTCMAKTNYFDDLYIGGDVEVVGTTTFGAISVVGNLTVDGTLVALDGSTSARLISAGFTSLEAAANRIGVSTTIYMSIATTAISGITTITHTGNAPAVVWTASGGFDFVGAIDLDAVTASGIISVDDVTDTSSAVTGSIHTDGGLGVAKKAWVGTDLAVDGTANLDDTDIDGTLDVAGTTGLFTCSTSVINYTPIFMVGFDVGAATTFTTTDTTGALAITMAGSGTAVTWTAASFDFVGSITLDAITGSGILSIDDVTDSTTTITGSIHTDGGLGVAKRVNVGTDLDVDGITNLDVTDIDDTLNVQGITTHQANVIVANATNSGAMYISAYNIVYTQTASAVTVFTIPANAYVTEVKVMTTTAFNESGTLTCDIGWSGTLEGFASDLDIKAADGWAYADVYSNFGLSVGGTARDILVSVADQNNNGTAGAATVYIEWTMGAPGAL